ncbi:protein-cysteine N-palmitoyltransferase Rasp-like [Amblyomma americanum]
MSADITSVEAKTRNGAVPHPELDSQRWKWDRMKVFHWVFLVSGVAYALWRLSVSEESAFLVKELPRAFKPSQYGFQRKQDNTHYGWRTTRSFATENWKWLLLHPVLARATAHFAPSLVPIFYAAYSCLFAASQLSWEVTIAFLCQHAVFYAVTALRIPALSYVVAFLMLIHRRLGQKDVFLYLYDHYGRTCYMVTYVAFHWNILRCMSYSVDFIRSEKLKPEQSRLRLPPYWKTLAYVIYLPTVYLGPLQNYDDYTAQLDKERPRCTPREVASAVARLLRSGAHFVLIEAMTHYIYSSAMVDWPWMIEKLDLPSVVGLVLAFHFFFYIRYLFTYGFAGALANAEGIEIPPHAKCIARLNKCTEFWRYFDRGMHLLIRKYFYEPVAGSRKGPGWLVLGTAMSFAFTWFWHDMEKGDGIWCALSVLGISFEVFVTEVRKWTPIKNIETRYLGTVGRMREAAALLGSPHYLLTILACLFHLADVNICLIVCRRILLGFPFPLVPVLAGLYSACHVASYIKEWEQTAKKKQA